MIYISEYYDIINISIILRSVYICLLYTSLDDLYQDAAIDITTDASVLQTMLEKDGFAGSDFDRRNEV